MPDLQKITRFYFRTADKVYCWDTKFKKSYLKAVKPGTIRILANGRLQYKKSAQEKALSGFIQIYIGDCLVNTFNSSKFNIAEWNNAVKKYKLTTAKLKKQQDLHKKLVHYPDKQPTRKSFNQTKSDLMKLADNGELKIVNKNLVSQMKLFFAQDLSNSSEYAQVEKDLKDLIDELHEELKDEIKKLNKGIDLINAKLDE